MLNLYKMTKVRYTGIGANESGIHTIEQFLEIMNREFTHKRWSEDPIYKVMGRDHYHLQFKDWVLPDDFCFFSLNDWIEYSGAELLS
jgi:hypothetical protein